MNETSVQPVSGVRTPESGVSPKSMALERAEHVSAREPSVQDVEKPAQPAEVQKAQSNHLAKISIHFNVDEETNRLVVVVTERESGRVIRTIPASEFEKLRAGDLLKLTA